MFETRREMQRMMIRLVRRLAARTGVVAQMILDGPGQSTGRRIGVRRIDKENLDRHHLDGDHADKAF
jgi:hypothetical protein